MENFVYHSPTKILFGNGQINNLAQEILPYGRKVLFVYGEKHIRQHGVYDRIVNLLQDADISWIDFGGVHPNPRMDMVYKGIDLCHEEKIDFILAVGGGSVSDTAKAIAAGAKSDFDIWNAFSDFLRRVPDAEKNIPREALPIGVVITKAGTGSEFDLTSVVTKWEEGTPHEKLLHMNPVFYPRFSICDPTLTYTLSAAQTAYGIADMMTHYFEQYFSQSENTEYLDRMKEGALKTIITCGTRVISYPEDYAARAELMYAALWSCSAQNITGVIPEWTSHFIEHEITALTDLNHGLGMAIIFPAWMKYVIGDHPARFARYASEVWNIPRNGRGDIELGMEGIHKTIEFWSSLGIPTNWSEAGVDPDILPIAAKRALRFGTMGTFKKLEEEDVLHILKSAC
ncbi:iron-containing alcohol dehydrogenase [Desulfobulbus sp. F5]|nr:iron-containing alcohol dehydrogenase [Desulfobulbus sp. F5]